MVKLRIGCSTTELPRPIDNKRLIGLLRTTPTILRHSCVEVHSPPALLIGDYSASILTYAFAFLANETDRSHPRDKRGCATWKGQSWPAGLPIVVEFAAVTAATDGDDRIGAANGPEHSGAFETGGDEGFATRFDHS